MSRQLLLPTVADHMAKAFPELNGRALAVTDANITSENIPSLPLVMVALAREDAEHSAASNGHITLDPDFLVEFWFSPEIYKDEKGAETPFWAYYDYETLRDQFIVALLSIEMEDGGQFEYVGLEVEALQHAIVIGFRVKYHTEWCDISVSEDGEGIPIDGFKFSLVTPMSITDLSSQTPEKDTSCP